MAMTKKMNRSKKKHKSMLDAFNSSTIMKMVREERYQLKKLSDSFFDNFENHTDLRYADGVVNYNNIDKKQAHKAIMELLEVDDSRNNAIQYYYDHIETKHQNIKYDTGKTGYENVDLSRSLKYKEDYEKIISKSDK